MPGPLDPRTDKVMRDILLDKLRRALMFVQYDRLDLKNLDPLRAEIEVEIQRLRGELSETQ